MKKELAPILVENIEKAMPLIEKMVLYVLGVKTKFRIEQRTYAHSGSDVFVTLEEDGKETTRQLTATPLLHRMFTNASIIIGCGYDEKDDICFFNVEVRYDHPGGGRNGLDLARFTVDFKNGMAEQEE